MSSEMQFKQAPKENLATWALVTKFMIWLTIGTIALLAVMAATLV